MTLENKAKPLTDKMREFLKLIGVADKAEAAASAAFTKAKDDRLVAGKSKGKGTAEEKAQKALAFDGLKAEEKKAVLALQKTEVDADNAHLQQELEAFPVTGYDKMANDALAKELKTIFPENEFTPSPLGDGLMRINGKVDFDAISLRMLPPRYRDEMLAEAAKGGPKLDDDMVTRLSGSGGARLRFIQQGPQGKGFLDGMVADNDEDSAEAKARKDDYRAQLKDLYEPAGKDAPADEQARAFDLYNKHKTGFDAIKDENTRLDEQGGLEFALRSGVTDLRQLVAMSEYFKAMRKQEIDDLVDVKFSKLTAKAAKREAREVVKKRYEGKDGMLSDTVFKEMTDNLALYEKAVGDTGVGIGATAVEVDAFDLDATALKIRAAAGTMKFGTIKTAAYHTAKHFSEIDVSEHVTTSKDNVENQVLGYHRAARAAVSGGVAKNPPSFSQNGGQSHFLKGKTATAIIWAKKGAAGLATYFKGN